MYTVDQQVVIACAATGAGLTGGRRDGGSWNGPPGRCLTSEALGTLQPDTATLSEPVAV